MKIGIDARVAHESSYYAQFVHTFVQNLCQHNSEHEIVVFSDHELFPNGALHRQILIPYSRYKVLHDGKTKKFLQEQGCHLYIFFDHHIPRGFKKPYFVLLENLKEVFFPGGGILHQFLYKMRLQKTISHAEKIFSLDSSTCKELNERLNISEERIHCIPGFFTRFEPEALTEIDLDIRSKHGLKGPYLIYDAGNGSHNNFERILRAIKKLKEKSYILNIIVLCEESASDIDLRNLTLEMELSEQILFLGKLIGQNIQAYYKQSLGVVYSSVYDGFPFSAITAIEYGSKIFASDITPYKETLGNFAAYLDSLSLHKVTDTLLECYNQEGDISYDGIFELYNPEKTVQKFLEHLPNDKQDTND